MSYWDPKEYLKEEISDLLNEKITPLENLLSNVATLYLTSFVAEGSSRYFSNGELQSLYLDVEHGLTGGLYFNEGGSVNRKSFLPSLNTLVHMLSKENVKDLLKNDFTWGGLTSESKILIYSQEFEDVLTKVREKIETFDYDYMVDLASEGLMEDYNYQEALQEYIRNLDDEGAPDIEDEWYWDYVREKEEDFYGSDEFEGVYKDYLEREFKENYFGKSDFIQVLLLEILNPKAIEGAPEIYSYGKKYYSVSEEEFDEGLESSELFQKAIEILENIKVRGAFQNQESQVYDLYKLLDDFNSIKGFGASQSMPTDLIDAPAFFIESVQGLSQLTLKNSVDFLFTSNVEALKDSELFVRSYVEKINTLSRAFQNIQKFTEKELSAKEVNVELFEYSDAYPEIISISSNAFNFESEITLTYVKPISLSSSKGEFSYSGDFERSLSKELANDVKLNVVLLALDGESKKESYGEKGAICKIDLNKVKIQNLVVLSEVNVSFDLLANKAESVILNPACLETKEGVAKISGLVKDLYGLSNKDRIVSVCGFTYTIEQVFDVVLEKSFLFENLKSMCGLKEEGIESLAEDLDTSKTSFLMIKDNRINYVKNQFYAWKEKKDFQLIQILSKPLQERSDFVSKFSNFYREKIILKHRNAYIFPLQSIFREVLTLLDLSECKGLKEMKSAYSSVMSIMSNFYLTANSPDVCKYLTRGVYIDESNFENFDIRKELSKEIYDSPKSEVAIFSSFRKPEYSSALKLYDVSNFEGFIFSPFDSGNFAFVKYIEANTTATGMVLDAHLRSDISTYVSLSKDRMQSIRIKLNWLKGLEPRNTLSYYESQAPFEYIEWGSDVIIKDEIFTHLDWADEINEETIMKFSAHHAHRLFAGRMNRSNRNNATFPTKLRFLSFSNKVTVKKNKVTVTVKGDGGNAFLSYLGVSSIVYDFKELDFEQGRSKYENNLEVVTVKYKVKRDFKLAKNTNFVASSILSYIYPQMLLRFQEHCQPNIALNHIPLGSAMELLTEEEVLDPQRFLTSPYGVISKILNKVNYMGCDAENNGFTDFYDMFLNGLDLNVHSGSSTRTRYIGALRYLYSFIDFYTKPLSILHNVLLNPGQYKLERANPLLKKAESSASSYSFRPPEAWLGEYCKLIEESQGKDWVQNSILKEKFDNSESVSIQDVEEELDHWSHARVKEAYDLQYTPEMLFDNDILGDDLLAYNTYADNKDKADRVKDLITNMLSDVTTNIMGDELGAYTTDVRFSVSSEYGSGDPLMESFRKKSYSLIKDTNGDLLDVDMFSKELNLCINFFARNWVRFSSDFISTDFYNSFFFRSQVEGGDVNVKHIADLSQIFNYGVFSSGIKKIKENKSTSLGNEKVPFVQASRSKGVIPYNFIRRFCKLEKYGKFGALPNETQEPIQTKGRLDLFSYVIITNLISTIGSYISQQSSGFELYGPTIWKDDDYILVQNSGIEVEGSFELESIDGHSSEDRSIVSKRLSKITENYSLCIGQSSQPLRGNILDGRAEAFCLFDYEKDLQACFYYLNGKINEIKAGGNCIIGAGDVSGMYRYGSTPNYVSIAENIDFEAVQKTFDFLFAMLQRNRESSTHKTYHFDFQNSDIQAVLPSTIAYFEKRFNSLELNSRFAYMSEQFKEVFFEAFSIVLDLDLDSEETEEGKFLEIANRGYSDYTCLPSLFFSEVWYQLNQKTMDDLDEVVEFIRKRDRFFGLMSEDSWKEDQIFLDRAYKTGVTLEKIENQTLDTIIQNIEVSISNRFFSSQGSHEQDLVIYTPTHLAPITK